ncbi:hypothetical protein [Halopseudomonas oceani]|uniref:hypothetical protein n=1 Tax=Halopseudomonas oceani TaxID=1708783 RepID=UPI002AA63E47|nr:hypothetical protein [Halopseudomonas oceani]
MSDIYSVSSILSSVFVFIGGFFLIFFVSRGFSVSYARASFLYAWHTAFCFLYLWYVLENGGDAIGYFRRGAAGLSEAGVGTSSVDFFISVVSYVIPLSILGVSLVFNLIGCVGLLAFDAALKQATLNAGRTLRIISSFIVFLPSVSFWSSGIGKDAVSFMAVCLSVWAALDFSKRMPLFFFSVLCMFFVRPHMAGLLVLAASASYLLSNRLSLARRFVFGVLAVSAAAVMVPFALKYAGVGQEVGLGGISDYISSRQNENLGGGSSVDISSMNFPAKLISYIFRPAIFEVNSVFSLAAALDNTLLLCLVLWGGWACFKKHVRVAGDSVFMWLYSMAAWVILSLTTANLGIALRQKWMFVPVLIYLFISALSEVRRKRSLDVSRG